MQLLSFRFAAGLLLFSTVLNAQGFNLNIQVTQNIACFGGAEGELSAVVTPVGAAYSFSWSSGQTTSVASGLTAGAYSVTVQSVSGAIVVATAVLSQPDALVLTPLTELPLAVDSTGSVEVETYGGVAPYAYQWFDQHSQLFSETEDLENAPAGVYSLNVSDAHGCMTALSPVTLVATSNNIDLAEMKFRLFPNPAEVETVVETPAGFEGTMQVFNATGQLMHSQRIQDTRSRIMVVSWPPGIYLVRFLGIQGTLQLLVL